MATRTITTKLAIEGESEYRKSAAAVKSELATLDSQLALVTSQFKNNANSMEALTARGGALSSLYEKQKEKVALLESALKNAQQAQERYAERVSTAQENIARCEKALDDLKDSTEDTSEEQAALTAELDKWNAELQEAQAYEAAAEKGVQNWQKQLNYANIDLNDLSDELDRNNQYLEEAAASADGCATSIDKYGKEVKDAGEESGKFGNKSSDAVKQLSGVLATAGVTAAVKEIAEALMDCSKAAAEFETSIAKVATIADTSAISMEEIESKIITLSSATGKSASAIAEATYSAISAGVDTASAVEFVEKATKLAAGGFTEAETAVDVLTTALNAYGLSVEETERVSDILITTQNLGKTTVDQLAQSVGKVIPLAAAYGVEMDNLGAAYAVLTANGVATAEAGTYLKSMLKELGDSGSTVSEILQEQTGKSFADLMASGSSLGDVLDILGQSVGGDATAFNELWASTEAGVGALSIFNSGAERYNTVLQSMQESAGATSDAYSTMADTTEHAETKMKTAFDNLKIAIGSQLNPALENLYNTGANAFSWATDFVNDNPWVVQAMTALVVGLGTLAVGLTIAANAANIATVAQAAYNAVCAANPVGLVVAGVVALGAALGTLALSMGQADEETRKLTESIKESKAAYEEAAAAMAEEQANTENLVAGLEALLEAEDKTQAQKDAILEMVDQLNEAIPGLALSYDAATDSINMTTEALEAMVEKSAAQEEYEAKVARLSELYTEQAEITSMLTASQDELSAAQEKQSETASQCASSYAAAGQAAATCNASEMAYAAGAQNAAQSTGALQGKVNSLTTALEDNQAQIEALEAETKEYGEWQAASGKATVEMQATVTNLISEMEGLEAEYKKSHDAAKESIDGQLGLFNTLDGSAKTSIGNLIKTLEGQVKYMDDYAANIQKAMEMGVDEGLVRKLSDGSEESAQILAAIVQGGEKDIAALNEQLAKVEEGKENFADTVAEMETDFDEKMGDIERRMAEAIDDLDASAEAGAVGANTIQGYIDGAESMRSQLKAKYKSLANAANRAYADTLEIHSPSRVFYELGKNTVMGAVLGAQDNAYKLETEFEGMADAAVDAMTAAIPQTVNEPRAQSVGEQTAALLSAVSGQIGGGDTFSFYVDKVEVREDDDIQRVARELYNMTQREGRSRGGTT